MRRQAHILKKAERKREEKGEMMIRAFNLNDIKPGERAVVKQLTAHGAMRRRLLDLGLVGGTAVECVGESPHGDPRAYLIRGAVVAIRRRDAANITAQRN